MPNSRQFVHDISKTKRELGYQPRYSYLKQLKDFKEEMLSNRFKLIWNEEEYYD